MIFSPRAKIYLLLGIAVFSFSSFSISLLLLCIVAAFTVKVPLFVYEEALDSYRSIRNPEESGLTGKIKLAVELLSSLFDRSLKKAKEMSGNNEADISESGNRKTP